LVVALFLFLPQCQVFLKELDYALSITEVIFLKLVNLVESILKCLISEFAGSLVVLHYFVVENGEI